MKKWRGKYPVIKKGANWCSLTQEAVALLLKSKRDIKKMTWLTNCSDEMYKQIVLLNSNLPCINDDLRFVDWKDMIHHPHIITMRHWANIRNSHKLFARKFDQNIDNEIIDKVFGQIGHSQN